MNPVTQAENEGRLIFFRNGQYKYIPSKKAQAKINESKRPFDSEKANKMHDLKISFRKHIWSEADRRLSKIEKYVDKGLVKIQNKEFILK